MIVYNLLAELFYNSLTYSSTLLTVTVKLSVVEAFLLNELVINSANEFHTGIL